MAKSQNTSFVSNLRKKKKEIKVGHKIKKYIWKGKIVNLYK